MVLKFASIIATLAATSLSEIMGPLPNHIMKLGTEYKITMNNQSFALRIGESIRIEAPEDQANGHKWEVEDMSGNLNAVVKILSNEYVPPEPTNSEKEGEESP